MNTILQLNSGYTRHPLVFSVYIRTISYYFRSATSTMDSERTSERGNNNPKRTASLSLASSNHVLTTKCQKDAAPIDFLGEGKARCGYIDGQNWAFFTTFRDMFHFFTHYNSIRKDPRFSTSKLTFSIEEMHLNAILRTHMIKCGFPKKSE